MLSYIKNITQKFILNISANSIRFYFAIRCELALVSLPLHIITSVWIAWYYSWRCSECTYIEKTKSLIKASRFSILKTAASLTTTHQKIRKWHLPRICIIHYRTAYYEFTHLYKKGDKEKMRKNRKEAELAMFSTREKHK